MEITPRMIRDVVFRERLRGYDEDHVDEFLERVATGVEILQERLRHAVERAELAERRSSERLEGDDAMRRTLTLARRTAGISSEISTAMMPITTSNSIRVNARSTIGRDWAER